MVKLNVYTLVNHLTLLLVKNMASLVCRIIFELIAAIVCPELFYHIKKYKCLIFHFCHIRKKHSICVSWQESIMAFMNEIDYFSSSIYPCSNWYYQDLHIARILAGVHILKYFDKVTHSSVHLLKSPSLQLVSESVRLSTCTVKEICRTWGNHSDVKMSSWILELQGLCLC